MKDHRYTSLSQSEEAPKEDGGDAGIDWNSTLEILPSNTKAYIFYLSLFLISLSANILLILNNPPNVCGRDLGKTIYSKYCSSSNDLKTVLTPC